MRFVMFYHSLVSDWNHGNAHFLRGIVSELLDRGHEVAVWEPRRGWSLSNLLANHGQSAIDEYRQAFPRLESRFYDIGTFDAGAALEGADVVIVHEWSPHALVGMIGRHRAGADYVLLFHDTHHRSVSSPGEMAAYDLRHYDGVLAFGAAIADIYRRRAWTERAWIWHEAADTRVFRPVTGCPVENDLVWVGNWGDEERTAELREYLLGPCRSLGLRAEIHGVRYPDEALAALAADGIAYRGWIANWRVPEVFARSRATVHVPRRPYVRILPGIPTIRVFEALACGIPLVSAPWDDCEGLFRPGADFLMACSGAEMESMLRDVLHDPALASSLSAQGLRTVLSRHTCAHRVDELLAILSELGVSAGPPRPVGLRASTILEQEIA